MEELDSIKDSIKKEIKKEKESLLHRNDKGAIKFFLDSISEDIKEMVNTGFNFKQQLDIINRSSGKEIKYATYIRYVKKNLSSSGTRLHNIRKSDNNGRVKFAHEALPDVNELY